MQLFILPSSKLSLLFKLAMLSIYSVNCILLGNLALNYHKVQKLAKMTAASYLDCTQSSLAYMNIGELMVQFMYCRITLLLYCRPVVILVFKCERPKKYCLAHAGPCLYGKVFLRAVSLISCLLYDPKQSH